jgi:hypothetical protein
MIILQPTGGMPIGFEGIPVFQGSSQLQNSAERTRFHRIGIYKRNQDWVVNINYITRWRGEHNFSEVWCRKDLDEIIEAISEHDPLKRVAGYPPGQRFAEKQRRLEIEIERDWEALKTLAFRALSTSSDP